VSAEARIDRYTSRERNVLVARGTFTDLFAAYREHSQRWVGEPDGLVEVMMRQALAAAGLHLTCRPRDEQTAWTLNLPEPPLNLFFTADAGTGRVVGRFFERHVETTADSRLFVQIDRGRGEPHLSVITVSGFDVLGILEQYYAQSEQATARFFEQDDDEFAMVMALPGVDDEWLRALTRETAREFIAGPQTNHIEERTVAFGCSCNVERILEIVAGIFREKEAELFGDDAQVEVQCPRCGRAYDLTREGFRAELGDTSDPSEDAPESER